MQKLYRAFYGFTFLTVGHMLPGPAIASLEGSGLAEFWIGRTELSSINGIAPDREDYTSYNGALRFQIPSESALSMQLDIDAEYSSVPDDRSSENFQESQQISFHLNRYNREKGRFGLLGGYGNTISDNGDKINGGEVEYWYAALEAQRFMDSSFGMIQLGGLDSENKGDSNADNFRDAYFIRAGISWFRRPDSRYSANIAYANGENDKDEDDSDIIEWHLRYDRAVHTASSGGTIGFFLAYRGARNESDVNERYDDHTVFVGIRWTSAAKTLRDQAVSGASLDTPGMGRWVATGEIFD